MLKAVSLLHNKLKDFSEISCQGRSCHPSAPSNIFCVGSFPSVSAYKKVMKTGGCNALGMRLGTLHLYSLLYERGARRGILCVSSEHILVCVHDGTLGMD